MAKRKEINPFSDDDGIDNEVGPEPDKEPEMVIDLDAETDDEPDEPAGPSRQEKRNQRTWMNREDRERLERERVEAQTRADTLAATNERLALALATAQRPAPAQPQRTQIDDEIDRAASDRAALDREYQTLYQAGQLTEAKAEELRKKAIETENRQIDLRAHRIVQQSGLQAQNPNQVQEQAIRAYVVAHFPEASQNPQALAFANGEQLKIVAKKGPAAMWSVETINASMDAAEKEFQLGRHKHGAPRAPDPGLRDRFQGAPRGSTGSSAGEGGRTFTVDKDFKRMADRAFSHITDPIKRYKHAYKMTREQNDE